MPSSDPSFGSVSLPSPRPDQTHDDATVISRGESLASWSGTATGPIAGGPATTGEIGRVLEGTMLGPYRLEQFIGGGGMGAVFRALDTTLHRTVAVKVLAGRQADDEEMLKRFRNEAQSAARLDHENIGRVHAVGSENGWHFIVFEYIEGTNLRDMIRAVGPFDLARTVDIAIQVADALEHASERDVVHRDIKPSNIVITPAGRARVVDMGLARLPQVADDRDLTVSGMTLGTFDYISPEQARDPRAADVRSDLYSLGCTIFFMLTGRPPFADGTMVQKLLQHQQQQPPALDDIRPDVPHRFAEIVLRLMAKDPLDRYQRPAVLVADLAAFAEEAGLPLGGARPAAILGLPLEPGAPSRLPWLVPLAGLLLVVAAMWAVSAWDRRATVTPPTTLRGADGAMLVRVVAGTPGADDATSLADAVRRVADGGVIELAYDGVRREEPLALAGRHLTLRPALGMKPVVEFQGGRPWGPQGTLVACDVGDGTLIVRDTGVRLAAAPAAEPHRALFAVRSGRLTFDGVTLGMPGDPSGPRPATETAPAFVAVTASPSGDVRSSTVVLHRTRAAGDAVFLDATDAGAGRVALRWHNGEFVSPRWLIAAEGTAGEILDIDCDLDSVAVACGSGVATLGDSPTRPVPPRLRLTAADSRIVVDAGRPFLEQYGGGDIDAYRAACQWTDRESHYEGGGAFRRIEAATEQIDEPIRDVVPPLFHQSIPGPLPDPTGWAGWSR